MPACVTAFPAAVHPAVPRSCGERATGAQASRPGGTPLSGVVAAWPIQQQAHIPVPGCSLAWRGSSGVGIWGREKSGLTTSACRAFCGVCAGSPSSTGWSRTARSLISTTPARCTATTTSAPLTRVTRAASWRVSPSLASASARRARDAK